MRLKKLRCLTNIRKNYFSQRIINDWNGLPAAAVFPASINVFKKKINVRLKMQYTLFKKYYNWQILYKHNTSLYKQNISLLYYY